MVLMIWLKWGALILVCLAMIAGVGLAAMIAFGTASAPEPMEAVIAPMRTVDYSDMPARLHFQARDGATLSYRLYPQAGERVAVLIHGSSGESSGMHALARALSGAGFAVFVPDLRGHAEDGRLGDIDYEGQLDDDLADLMQVVRRGHPNAGVDLVGHSSGGGFVLRIAEGDLSSLFARYFLLAPALHYNAPTWRPEAGGWARTSVPRIMGLTILDRFGVTRFQHLPVVAFAVFPDVPVRLAPAYSLVMSRNFAAPPDDLERLGQVRAPLMVLAGDKDEIFYADRFAPLLLPRRPGTPINVLPNVGHMGLITQPEAIAAIVTAMN